LPPGTGAGVGVLVVGALAVILLAGVGFVEEVAPFLATGDHAIDGAPIGEAAHVTVVDKDIGLQLAGEVGIIVGGLFRIVAVGGVELDATLAAPLQCCFEELALATGPEDHAMAVGNEHLEGLYREGALSAYLRIAVLNNRTVKINCNDHFII